MNVRRFTRRHPECGVLAALCVFALFFSIFGSNFATPDSVTAMLTVAAELGIIAVGVSFLMISGEFDLSVGSVLLFSTYVFILLANAGVDPFVAFVLAVLSCGVLGLINAFVTLKLDIPSFITTLGAMMFWRGLVVFLTGGSSLSYEPNADSPLIEFLGGNPFLSFRNTIIWFVLLTLVLHFVLTRTRYGNWVYATGGNVDAARNVGVPVIWVKSINFALCGMLAGLAGVANVARFGIVQGQLGFQKELEAIAAAVIGGNLLTGGRGSILGTFIGAVFISMLRTGLISMGSFLGIRDFSYLHLPLTGVIIILAVIINRKVVGMKK